MAIFICSLPLVIKLNDFDYGNDEFDKCERVHVSIQNVENLLQITANDEDISNNFYQLFASHLKIKHIYL